MSPVPMVLSPIGFQEKRNEYFRPVDVIMKFSINDPSRAFPVLNRRGACSRLATWPARQEPVESKKCICALPKGTDEKCCRIGYQRGTGESR